MAVAVLAVAGPVTGAVPSAGIEVFRDASTFEASVHVRHRLSFDDVAAGTLYPGPATFDTITFSHSTAVNWVTIGGLAYTARSAPNVLAPFTAGSTLAFGETTLTFARNTRSAGLFLVLVSGSNATAFPSTVVTAMDSKGQTIQSTVVLQGTVGEQRFIGFSSRWRLVSISFGPAVLAGSFTAVLAMDDVVTD